MMTEKDLRWNKFIEEVCEKDITKLSDIQKKAVLCFLYDSEMNSGGYSGFIDCYPDIDDIELKEAIMIVGNKEIADNYQKAIDEGENDDYFLTDTNYYNFSPSLGECLEEFVEENKDEIFR